MRVTEIDFLDKRLKSIYTEIFLSPEGGRKAGLKAQAPEANELSQKDFCSFLTLFDSLYFVYLTGKVLKFNIRQRRLFSEIPENH